MDRIESLQKAINARQTELHSVAKILTREAERRRRASAASKVLVVLLGALSATNGAAIQVAGATVGVVVVYTVIGLAVATLGGLDAAFKVSERAGELTTLAATCHSTTREIDSRWRKEVDTAYNEDRAVAALRLIDLQDIKLTEVQDRAARLGVNIALEVRELQAEAGGLYPA